MQFRTHSTTLMGSEKSAPLPYEKKVFRKKKINEDGNNLIRAPSRSNNKDSQSLLLCRNQSSGSITRNIIEQ